MIRLLLIVTSLFLFPQVQIFAETEIEGKIIDNFAKSLQDDKYTMSLMKLNKTNQYDYKEFIRYFTKKEHSPILLILGIASNTHHPQELSNICDKAWDLLKKENFDLVILPRMSPSQNFIGLDFIESNQEFNIYKKAIFIIENSGGRDLYLKDCFSKTISFENFLSGNYFNISDFTNYQSPIKSNLSIEFTIILIIIIFSLFYFIFTIIKKNITLESKRLRKNIIYIILHFLLISLISFTSYEIIQNTYLYTLVYRDSLLRVLMTLVISGFLYAIIYNAGMYKLLPKYSIHYEFGLYPNILILIILGLFTSLFLCLIFLTFMFVILIRNNNNSKIFPLIKLGLIYTIIVLIYIIWPYDIIFYVNLYLQVTPLFILISISFTSITINPIMAAISIRKNSGIRPKKILILMASVILLSMILFLPQFLFPDNSNKIISGTPKTSSALLYSKLKNNIRINKFTYDKKDVFYLHLLHFTNFKKIELLFPFEKDNYIILSNFAYQAELDFIKMHLGSLLSPEETIIIHLKKDHPKKIQLKAELESDSDNSVLGFSEDIILE